MQQPLTLPAPSPRRSPWLVVTGLVATGLAPIVGLGCRGPGTSGAGEALTVVCTDDIEGVPVDVWWCPGSVELECRDGGAAPELVYVDGEMLPGEACGGHDFVVGDPGPYAPGHHGVLVSTDDGAPVCIAELEVVDTMPPAALPLSPASLWPPNHRMIAVHIDDCVVVEDRCDRDARAHFTRVTSDEAADDHGDGATMPDMALVDCDRVELRAERDGRGDGRVYTLHWRAEDSSGNFVDGLCRVEVPHDQSGAPAIGGPPQVSMAGCVSGI